MLIGEAFIAVRADTTAFSAQVASAASAAAGAAGTTASQSFSQKFATGATALGKTMTRSVTLPLAGIGIAAGVTAANFETAFSRMSGLVGVSDEQLGKFRQSVLSLAGETAQSPQALAEALYFITSSGQSGAQALNTLEISAKAASAGLGETKVIADTVTSAMSAYGPEALSAAKATDILVAGVKFGKAEADELAAGLGNVAPLASQLGISFEDLTATIASMTLVGVDVDTAFTNVSAVMSGLLKATPQTERALNEVGLTSGELRDTLGKPGGLVEAMRMVDTAFAGNDEAMAQVFPNIRALRGVMALLAQDSGQVSEVFEGVTNSTGSLDKAFKSASETSAFKFKQGLADLQVAAIELGNDLLPVADKIINFASGLANAFVGLPDVVQNFILIGAGAAAALGPISRLAGAGASLVDAFTRSDSGLRNFASFLAGPWGLAIGGAAAVAGTLFLALTEGGRAQQEFEGHVRNVTAAMKEQQSTLGETTRDWIINTALQGESGDLVIDALRRMGAGIADLEAAAATGGKSWDTFSASVVRAAEKNGVFGAELGFLQGVLEEIGQVYDATNDRVARQGAVLQDAKGAAESYMTSVTTLGTVLAENGSTLDAQTRRGQENRVALQDAAQAALNHSMALGAESNSAQVATDTLIGHAGQLVQTAMQTGISEQKAVSYIGQLLGIPKDVLTGVTNTADLAAAIANGYRTGALDPLRGTWNSTITANTGPARAALQGLLDTINNSSATIQVRAQAVGNIVSPFQHGGVTHGGIGLFGERGPEIGVAPKGTRILTHGESMQAAREAIAMNKISDHHAPAASTTNNNVSNVTKVIVVRDVQEAAREAGVPAPMLASFLDGRR